MCADRTKITVGVCGGIAAYKAVELVRLLQDAGLDPHVVMTRAAEEFIRPLTFEAISGHKVITSLWGDDSGARNVAASEESELLAQGVTVSSVEHINEAQTTKLLVVAPATAHVLAKFAHGLADDFLSTMFLATTAPIIVAPAMNVNMWNHAATQANVALLRSRGVHVVDPGTGYLACGMVGGGRLADPVAIAAAVVQVLARSKAPHSHKLDFSGETVLVTAGGTREAIDPVRFIGNRSSGRMGYALAEAALQRGARVILITAPTGLTSPAGCDRVEVVSAEEMRRAVMARLAEASVVIMAAAVSDYTVKQVAAQKIKREEDATGAAVNPGTGNRPSNRTLELAPTADILREAMAGRRPGTLVIGFAAETANVLANGREKLARKGVDAVVVNDVSAAGMGFDSERNAATFLTPGGAVELPAMSKVEMAGRILNEIQRLRV